MTRLTASDSSPTAPYCFGCMQFGGTADATESRAMFDACRDAGINFFDTAHVYTDGKSEEILGRAVRQEREALIIATKAGYVGGNGRDNIRKQFDESRQRLNLDTVDLLYLHRWDPATPLQETFETLSDLQTQGKIRYIGVSNFAAWQVMKAQSVAAQLGTAIDVIQPMYSLVKRQAEVELFPMSLAEGIAVVPYSPLGGGLLTGKYQKGEAGRLSSDQRYAERYGQQWMMDTATALSEMAEEMAIDAATLAVAWAARHPAVSAPIISARNTKQLEPSLKAMKTPLSGAQYAALEALSPRPAPATDRLEEAEA